MYRSYLQNFALIVLVVCLGPQIAKAAPPQIHLAQTEGENCVTHPYTPFCQRMLKLGGNRQPEFANRAAELEHRYKRDCIGPKQEHTQTCRRLKHDAEQAAQQVGSNIDHGQLAKDACTAEMLKISPELCAAVKQKSNAAGKSSPQVSHPVTNRDAPISAHGVANSSDPSSSPFVNAPAHNTPPGDCDCNKIEGQCTARVTSKGNWITVMSSSFKCSWVSYRINGWPGSTTFKGGFRNEPLVGQTAIQTLEIEFCKVCKTGP